jgi:hypothetical protein
MANESKSDRFRRLATKRTVNVLQALRVLGNCANRAVYQYTDDDVRKIFNAVDKQLADVRAKFKETNRFEFKL